MLQDRVATSFGIRSFTAGDKRFHLNGRPVFLRGTLDCCIFPLTGYPPTDPDGWRKAFGTVQAYGLNHVRFHSWCPPEAAFAVADELGLLLHIETPVWPVLGQDPALDRYIHAEAERIVAAYGNHPSFVMLAVGNEVHGAGLHAFLERFVAEWKARDPRRLYTGGSGWPTTQRADFASKPEPRNQRWGEELDGRLNARALETRTDWSTWCDSVPMALVSHETGQWCVYPNLAEIEKYTGVLEARNLMTVRDDLAARGRFAEAGALLMASGRLQTKLYKEEMEAALRTRGFAGTQLPRPAGFPGAGDSSGRRCRRVLGQQALCDTRGVPAFRRPGRAAPARRWVRPDAGREVRRTAATRTVRAGRVDRRACLDARRPRRWRGARRPSAGAAMGNRRVA